LNYAPDKAVVKKGSEEMNDIAYLDVPSIQAASRHLSKIHAESGMQNINSVHQEFINAFSGGYRYAQTMLGEFIVKAIEAHSANPKPEVVKGAAWNQMMECTKETLVADHLQLINKTFDLQRKISDDREEIIRLTQFKMALEQALVDGKKGLRFADLFRANAQRVERWHSGGVEDWTALEWAGAMCGEAGEAANCAKKLKRIETGMININEAGRSLTELSTAQEAVAREVADTIIYGLLLMARVGVDDPDEAIRGVFNRKSDEYGFPERL
jgi:hypothetical protein